MTKRTVVFWCGVFIIGGGGALLYLLQMVPPHLPDGTLNIRAFLAVLGAFFALSAGIGGWGALALHRHYPRLGGANGRPVAPPVAALRQGLLLGGGAVGVALLAFFDNFDSIIVVTILLFALLAELYLQKHLSAPAPAARANLVLNSRTPRQRAAQRKGVAPRKSTARTTSRRTVNRKRS
ncbi:MAG: hypothetical protein R3C14_11790 [Caldilineaceae bacterium]